MKDKAPSSNMPEVVRVKLVIPKKTLRTMTRIKRWEERSANTNLVLGPGKK